MEARPGLIKNHPIIIGDVLTEFVSQLDSAAITTIIMRLIYIGKYMRAKKTKCSPVVVALGCRGSRVAKKSPNVENSFVFIFSTAIHRISPASHSHILHTRKFTRTIPSSSLENFPSIRTLELLFSGSFTNCT